MADNPFEQLDTSNPFENLGLSKDAVEAIVALGDPEALQQVATTIMRGMARVLHPDVAGTQTTKSNDFYRDMMDAAQDIKDQKPEIAMTLAKAFAKPSKRGRAAVKKEVIIQEADYSLQVIESLASAGFGELGITLNPETRLQIIDQKQIGINQGARTYKRVGPDEFEVSYSELIGVDRDIEGNEDYPERVGALLMPYIPWKQLMTIEQRVSSKGASPGLAGAIEVTGSAVYLLDRDNNRLGEFPEDIRSITELSRPGIYGFSALHDKKHFASTGELTIINPTLSTSSWHPTDDPITTEHFRLLGSLAPAFQSHIQAAYVAQRDTLGDKRLRAIDVGTPNNPHFISPGVGMFGYTKFKHHFEIPEKFLPTIGKHYQADLKEDNYALAKQDDKMVILGKIHRFYPAAAGE